MKRYGLYRGALHERPEGKWALYEEAEAEVARLRELLRDVATSGQVMPDRRMHYTEVQIDWSTWDALAEFAKDSP